MERRRVVITGLGAVTPLGNDISSFWNGVREGKCGIGPITLFDAADFKASLAAEVKDFHPEAVIDRKELRHMDRFTQFAVCAAHEPPNVTVAGRHQTACWLTDPRADTVGVPFKTGGAVHA